MTFRKGEHAMCTLDAIKMRRLLRWTHELLVYRPEDMFDAKLYPFECNPTDELLSLKRHIREVIEETNNYSELDEMEKRSSEV